jgi:phospholipid/cholesterol/gamma-HCH transport system permease protein
MIHRLVSNTGGFVLRSVWGAGYTLTLLGQAVRWLPASVVRRREIRSLLFTYGVRTLPVVTVVAAFTGMILSLQTGLTLMRYGQQEIMGSIVAVAMCREMGPFITGLILTATSGSSIAAEIGTMKVSEEIDALEVMSIPPERFLVMPRLIALTFACPALTFLTMMIGTLGGAVIARHQLGVSYTIFFDNAVQSLRTPDFHFSLPKDIYTGLFKATVFGISIASVACASGLRAEGGALGVGRAARSAVLVSFLLILILGYIMTWMFYR